MHISNFVKDSCLNITNFLSESQFKYTVNYRIKRYNNGYIGPFSIGVVDISSCDSNCLQPTFLNCPFQRFTFTEYIAPKIAKIVTPKQGNFTIADNDRFLLLLPETYTAQAELAISKEVTDLANNLNNCIDIYTKVVEFPRDGLDCEKLLNEANYKIDIVKDQRDIPTSSKQAQSLLVDSLIQVKEDVKSLFMKELSLLIAKISKYDSYLGEHSALVTKGSVLLAKQLGLEWQDIEKIAIAALLHDIGYTSIPKNILYKKGKLVNEEWKLIQLHPTIACDHILKPLQIFNEYLPLIQNHHEFINGSGYPNGLSGSEIPLGAQIISIIDSYQAMRVDRPYRSALEPEYIADVFNRNAGIKWNKELVKTFTTMISDPENYKLLSDSQNFSLGDILAFK